MSPKSLILFSEIFLNILLIILPDLVFGNPLENCILSIFACGPIIILTFFIISSSIFFEGKTPKAKIYDKIMSIVKNKERAISLETGKQVEKELKKNI